MTGSGSWTDVDSLDFISPNTILVPAGPLDGNLTANRRFFSTNNLTTIAPGQKIYIRWVDRNIAGNDDGLAIDDVTVAFTAAPTAAAVSVSGQVVDANGRGIAGARLSLATGDERAVITMTGPFGYFNFAGVASGRTYILSVAAKNRTFANATRIISVGDDIADLKFISDR